MTILRVCTSCGSLEECDCKARAKRKADKRRPNARARGYDNRWEATRSRYLSSHMTCQDEMGCIEAATDVHHLDGLGPKGAMGHDFSNLQALCKAHHSQITSHQQPGGWNA